MTPGATLLILAAQCADALDHSNMRSEAAKRRFDGMDSWLIGSDGAASVFQKFEAHSFGPLNKPPSPGSLSQKQRIEKPDFSAIQLPDDLKDPLFKAFGTESSFNPRRSATALVEQPATPAPADPSATPPTLPPTVPPTVPPTADPAAPTEPPTADPAAPTVAPTVAPTTDPNAPTAAPTVAPTVDPTAPTVDPSASPAPLDPSASPPPTVGAAAEHGGGGLGFLGWTLIILGAIILFAVFGGGRSSSGGGGGAPARGAANAGNASRGGGGGYASRRAAGGALNAAQEAQGSAPLLEPAPAEATPSRGGYAARRKQAEQDG